MKGGKRYFPVAYLSDKILLRGSNILTPSRKVEFIDYIENFSVDFTFVNAGVQKTNCISEEGLSLVLEKQKLGSFDVKQRKALNEFYRYLNDSNDNKNKTDTEKDKQLKYKEVDEGENFIENINMNVIKTYSIYLQDVIEDSIENEYFYTWQKCSKCNKYFPYTETFFRKNEHSSKELYTVCKECQKYDNNGSKTYIKHSNKEYYNVYRKYGEEVYLMYKNHETVKIYEHYIATNKKGFPKTIYNKTDALDIIKYYYKNKQLNDEEIEVGIITKKLNIPLYAIGVSVEDIYLSVYGENYRLYPWKCNVKLYNLSQEEAVYIVKNYIKENNIIIDDLYNFKYLDIINACHLKRISNEDLLGFVMLLYDNKYPAYKFNISSKNYWEDKQNRDVALKYYIEEDLKIPIEKIPLYLTKYRLRQTAGTLYNLLYAHNYYKNLFEWIEEIYPGKFIESDFNINHIRNEFGSLEEGYIHDLLKLKFKNIIYNAIHNENTIKVKGMIPDWIILTDNNCWLIEYFGLYETRGYGINTRQTEYIDKANKKIEKYKQIKGYKSLFLYPEDLSDDFKGLKEKIKVIK